MIRIKLLKKTIYGESGEVIEVSRNQAHALIDGGEGVIVVEELKKNQPRTHYYQDKMLRSKK